jgi:glutathione S-transferase
MAATLFGVTGSHPSYAAELMLRGKGVAYERKDLPLYFHRGLLRVLRFRGATVPALRLEDGRRVQTTRRIARALDAMRPDPPLVPADPARRARVEEIESWADGEFQQLARRMSYWALRRDAAAVDTYLEGTPLILPRLLVRPAAPLIIRILAHDHDSTDAAIRQDLADLPRMLDRVDGWIAEGVLGGDPPNVADFQVATTLALLRTQDALRPAIDARPAGELAQRVAPGYGGRVADVYPAEWLAGLR